MKASFWPLATSCSSPKSNISALRTACAKVIKRHNNNNNNNNNNKNDYSKGTFCVSEQRLVDQANTTRRNSWMTELVIEELKRNLAENDIYKGEEISADDT